MFCFILGLTCAGILLFAQDAFAWGPGVHTLLSTSTLEVLRSFTGKIASVVVNYPLEFIWGSVSADIILGKNFARWREHSHNWDVIFNLLNKTEGAVQKSFLYGYISHLAADTIAHNFFVPEMALKNLEERGIMHMRMEARAEMCVPKRTWQILKEVLKKARREECDALLERNIKGTIIPSVKANRAIYLRLVKFEVASRSLARGKNYEWVAEYIKQAEKASVDILMNLKNSGYKKIDPRGIRPLEASMALRKIFVRMERKGVIKDGDEEKFLRILSEFQPDIEPTKNWKALR